MAMRHPLTSAPAPAVTLELTPLDDIHACWDPVGLSLPEVCSLWQMLLLGDGSMTRTLAILTGQRVGVEVVSTQAVGVVPSEWASHFAGQRMVQRRVFLGIPSGERLLYAVSWWPEARLRTYLPDPQRPIGTALAQQKREVFRDLRSVYRGSSTMLNTVWQHQGSLWGRRYALWHQQQVLTVIDEVFAPHLSRYWHT
ncbi:MAG: chorismate lyase [Synechococcales cyanobacterium]